MPSKTKTWFLIVYAIKSLIINSLKKKNPKLKQTKKLTFIVFQAHLTEVEEAAKLGRLENAKEDKN